MAGSRRGPTSFQQANQPRNEVSEMGGMGAQALLQQTITITGDTTAGDVDVLQDMDDWVDAGNYADAIFTVHTMSVNTSGGDTAALFLATVDEKRLTHDEVPDGPGWTVKTFDPIASDQWYKHASLLDIAAITADEKPIDRWLMWGLTVTKVAGGGAFSITFEINVTFKRPA